MNHSTKGSYRGRCFAAGLSHSAGPSWHLSPWKAYQGRSPGHIFKKKFISREKSRAKRALRYSSQKPKKRAKKSAGPDKEYGPLAIEPDIEDCELKEKMKVIIESLKDEAQTADEIERQTVGQHNNQAWKEKRLNRITASTFGQVVKRLDHTPCHNLVKSILYSRDLSSESIIFGRLNEKKAVDMYEAATKLNVDNCGLFVSIDYPFLGASPYGLVGQEGLIEVKCLPSVEEELESAVKKKKTLCLEMSPENQLQLKRKHNYFYQIQEQLSITNRKWCDLVVLTKADELYIERIEVDRALWENFMVPKLKKFYFGCILPEIADSRITRGLKVRDPDYILLAMERKRQSKKPKGR